MLWSQMSHPFYLFHWRGHFPSLCTSRGDCRSPGVPVALFLYHPSAACSALSLPGSLQPGSPWGLCPHCESNPKSKSKHLHREWESWVLMRCRGVRTHLPETAWNHEMPGKARAGWGRAWGSGEVEGGRVTHMRKPHALRQEKQALGSALSLLLLRSWWDISILGTHCPGAQDTRSVLCQPVTPSSAF